MWNFSNIDPAAFRAPARKVTRVFLHCTDSDAVTPEYFGPPLAATIDGWHKAPPRCWAGIGYHFVVDKRGQVVTGRPLEIQPAAQLGPDGLGNVATIAISTHGSKVFTRDGLLGTRALVRAIDAAYVAAGAPVKIFGHTEIDPRPCPVYDWRALMGLNADRRFGAMPFADVDTIATKGANMPKLAIVDPPADPIGTRDLFEGCHGEDVTALQLKLCLNKFDTKGVDGWFGPDTFKAVVAWQHARGIAPANGIVPKGTTI